MKKDKTYLIVCLRETDGDPEILNLSGQSVREFAKRWGHESFAIIEGNLIKGFDSKFDLTRL